MREVAHAPRLAAFALVQRPCARPSCPHDAVVGPLCVVHADDDAHAPHPDDTLAPASPIGAELSRLIEGATALRATLAFEARRRRTVEAEVAHARAHILRETLVACLGTFGETYTSTLQPALGSVAVLRGRWTPLAARVARELAADAERAAGALWERRLAEARARLWREQSTFVRVLLDALAAGGAS